VKRGAVGGRFRTEIDGVHVTFELYTSSGHGLNSEIGRCSLRRSDEAQQVAWSRRGAAD
jgi:hypothetical protein